MTAYLIVLSDEIFALLLSTWQRSAIVSAVALVDGVWTTTDMEHHISRLDRVDIKRKALMRGSLTNSR
jgi:hypothetical protein